MAELEQPKVEDKPLEKVSKEVEKKEVAVEAPKVEEKKGDESLEKVPKVEEKDAPKNDDKGFQKGGFQRGGFQKGGFQKGGRRPPRKTPEELMEEHLGSWVPQTKLGHLVKEGKIKSLDEILDKGMKILESEVVDTLTKVSDDLLFAGQAKGKFGGGKRRAWRQAQKKTKEGNVITFSSLVVIGDRNGHVGLGMGKAKETLPAREKGLRKAKLNIQKIKRGSGSFDGSSSEPHSIPFEVEGKCGSVRIKLMPAPQGTGLVIGDEGKKILKLVGIKDIYSKSFGQTGTTLNYSKAIMDALGKLK
jgi:small subunit ribosomal protein S5